MLRRFFSMLEIGFLKIQTCQEPLTLNLFLKIRINGKRSNRLARCDLYVCQIEIRTLPKGKDAVTLTNEQKGILYLLLKNMIDVFDQRGIG